MHEGARNRRRRLPLMLSRGRDCNRSVFTDSCCTRYLRGAMSPYFMRISIQKLLDLGRR
jgi:hypothetical protein